MKIKNKLFVICLLSCMIYPFLITPFSVANPDINWPVSKGQTYTWNVIQSNTNLGFLPVNSKISLRVNHIVNEPSGSEEQSTIYANITEYNSESGETNILLDNSTFTIFDANVNSTMIFSSFLYHGIFIPSSHKEGFVDGFISYLVDDLSLGPAGDMDYSAHGQSAYALYGYDSTTDLMYIWIFMGNSLIASEIVIAYLSSPDVYQYYASLEKQSSIPFGNTFLLFSAVAVVSLIYLSQKRINKK